MYGLIALMVHIFPKVADMSIVDKAVRSFLS